MANNTTKIVAVVVVVIVVIVVAAAAVILLSNDDKDSAPATSAIYGNVNEDYYIDDEDVELIQDIIDGKREASDWPLADANLDGKVDEADLEVVRSYMNGESTTLYVVNCDGNPVAVPYPIEGYAATTGTNFRTVIAVLGLADGMAANATNSYTSEVLDKALYDGRASGEIYNLSSSSIVLTVDDVTTLVNLGVTVVLSEDGGMSTDNDVVKYIEGAGIVYLQLNYRDTSECLDSCKCLGILFGCEEKAQDYCEWCNGIMDTIIDKEGDLFGTVTCLSAVMSNYVNGTTGDYYAATVAAGGDNIADWEGNQRFNVGDTWLYDHDYDVDYFFHFRSGTFPTVPTSNIQDARTYFGETYTFQSGGYYLINGVIPLPVRNALMAEIMYPDCFEEGWADGLFQYYFEHFLGQEWDPSYEYYWNVTATSP